MFKVRKAVIWVWFVIAIALLQGCGNGEVGGGDEDVDFQNDVEYEKPDYDWPDGDFDDATDGLADEESADDSVSEVSDEEPQQPTIEWCQLHYPTQTSVIAGAETEPIFGWVYVPGRTEGEGQGEGIIGQLGFGDASAALDGENWLWVDAAYNTDKDGLTQGDLANDEYMATLKPHQAGSFGYAYRFSVDGGSTWTYCGTNGIINPSTPTDLGTLTVEPSGTEPEIGWCILQYPPEINETCTPDCPTAQIYGRVYVAGVTEGEGKGEGVVGQLVLLKEGSETEQYVDAQYSGDVDGLHAGDKANDEYMVELDLEDYVNQGTWYYLYRFSVDGGNTWTYCDLNGVVESDEPERGRLVVERSEGPEPPNTWCKLENPDLGRVPLTQTNGEARSVEAKAVVFVDGITNGTGRGELDGIVEYALIPSGSSFDDASWTAATYCCDTDGYQTGDLANDVYSGELMADSAGEYLFAFRVVLTLRDWEGNPIGQKVVMCDADGSENGFDESLAGRVEFVETQSIDWCNLQYPEWCDLGPEGTCTFYGQVLKWGITDVEGQGEGILAQIGFGPAGTSPIESTEDWGWFDAVYNVDVGNNDEYMFTAERDNWQAPAVMLDVAFRFSADNGVTWFYCDLDSSENGYQTEQSGILAVFDEWADWCNLQYPESVQLSPTQVNGLPDSAEVYGQVYEPGLTEADGAAQGLQAQLCFGPTNVKPWSTNGWTCIDATFNVQVGNNDEWKATLQVSQLQDGWGYVFRFKLPNASAWRYCDLDGPVDSFTQLRYGTIEIVTE